MSAKNNIRHDEGISSKTIATGLGEKNEKDNKDSRGGALAIFPVVDFQNMQLATLRNHDNSDRQNEAAENTNSWIRLRDDKQPLPVVPLQRVSLGADLNVPPDNWLRGLHRALERGEPRYSSIRLAAGIADKISWHEAAIDLISNATIIKQLIKSPFSNESLSLVVHRVGDTVLIDNFEVKGDVNDFSDRATTTSCASPTPATGKSTNSASTDAARSSSNGTSKVPSQFDSGNQEYNSKISPTVCAGKVPDEVFQPCGPGEVYDPPHKFNGAIVRKAIELDGFVPKLAQPRLNTKKNSNAQRRERLISKFVARSIAPDAAKIKPEDSAVLGHEHQHAWVFKDLRCLLSSELSIFGDSQHPAVSLRLRKADSSPIQVLTGMDMWLDNLMCNVPEVMMCYHLNGIVQQYELMRTEEIPTVSGFEPEVVQDVAQNIVSFIRSNCAKEGHTYWLYKDGGSDVVRLYDLTELCEKENNEDPNMKARQGSTQNPFAYPVAMLLFRIASRIYTQLIARSNTKDNFEDSATVCSLLQNALDLIDESKYPTVAANAAYILAGLSYKDKETPSTSPVPALKLRQVAARQSEARDSDTTEDESDSADNIPGKRANAELGDGLKDIERSIRLLNQESESTPITRTLLEAAFSRAAQIYLGIAEVGVATRNALRALKDIYQGLKMCAAAKQLQSFRNSESGGNIDEMHNHQLAVRSALEDQHLVVDKESFVVPSLLELAGDIWCQFDYFFGDAEVPSSNIVDNCNETDVKLSLLAKSYGPNSQSDRDQLDTWEQLRLPMQFANVAVLEAVEYAISLYNRCLALTSESLSTSANDNDLLRIHKKLGNAYNIIGVKNMDTAAALPQGGSAVVDSPSWHVAHKVFIRSVAAFHVAEDRVNQALVNCNIGKLMRTACSALLLHRGGGEPTKRENSFHENAIRAYRAASLSLGERDHNPQIWDAIRLELAGAHFAFASFLQDNSGSVSVASEGVGKHVCDGLMQSLSYYSEVACPQRPLNPPPQCPRWVLCRIPAIHLRLGEIYTQNSARAESGRHAKSTGRLAMMHFQKAIEGLHNCGCDVQDTICLEGRIQAGIRVALLMMKGNPTRKLFQDAVEILKSILAPLKQLTGTHEAAINHLHKVLTMVCQDLLQILQICLKSNSTNWRTHSANGRSTDIHLLHSKLQSSTQFTLKDTIEQRDLIVSIIQKL